MKQIEKEKLKKEAEGYMKELMEYYFANVQVEAAIG